jgi:glyoxylase-like metal-dependent hydrolase (beta-lactamase superfamily II)
MVEAPEQIAPGVYRIDTLGIPNAISVLLVADGDGWMLVDTGLRGGASRIQEAMSALGAGPGELRRIYLTHHHGDHIGGLPAVRWWATAAEVVASEHEAQVPASSFDAREAREDPLQQGVKLLSPVT